MNHVVGVTNFGAPVITFDVNFGRIGAGTSVVLGSLVAAVPMANPA